MHESLLNEIADAVESNEMSVDELPSLEKIKDDIDCLESRVYGDGLDDLAPWCVDDEDDEDDSGFVEMVCPQCNDTIFFDAALVHGQEALVCPNCENT